MFVWAVNAKAEHHLEMFCRSSASNRLIQALFCWSRRSEVTKKNSSPWKNMSFRKRPSVPCSAMQKILEQWCFQNNKQKTYYQSPLKQECIWLLLLSRGKKNHKIFFQAEALAFLPLSFVHCLKCSLNPQKLLQFGEHVILCLFVCDLH